MKCKCTQRRRKMDQYQPTSSKRRRPLPSPVTWEYLFPIKTRTLSYSSNNNQPNRSHHHHRNHNSRLNQDSGTWATVSNLAVAATTLADSPQYLVSLPVAWSKSPSKAAKTGGSAIKTLSPWASTTGTAGYQAANTLVRRHRQQQQRRQPQQLPHTNPAIRIHHHLHLLSSQCHNLDSMC